MIIDPHNVNEIIFIYTNFVFNYKKINIEMHLYIRILLYEWRVKQKRKIDYIYFGRAKYKKKKNTSLYYIELIWKHKFYIVHSNKMIRCKMMKTCLYY